LGSVTLISSAIFLLVNTGRRSLLIFFARSESCLRTKSADRWSLKGRIIQTGLLTWTSSVCSLSLLFFCVCSRSCDSMNLVIVQLMSLSGYLSFIKSKKPTLNTQSDSVKAKIFIWQFKCTTLGILFLFINYFYLLIICTETFTRTFNI